MCVQVENFNIFYVLFFFVLNLLSLSDCVTELRDSTVQKIVFKCGICYNNNRTFKTMTLPLWL